MDVLFGFLIITVLFLAATLGSVAWLHWRLKRQNRVSPATPSDAPLVWLWSPTTPARTHRRLRTTVATARTVPRDPQAPSHSQSALSLDVEQHAVALDQWLLWTSRAPTRWRRDHYRAIIAQVHQLETVTFRLTAMTPASAQFRLEDADRSLDDLRERLEQLEQAHAEIRAIERVTAGEALPHMGAVPRSTRAGS